jgi:hypothetical protein
MTWAKLNLNKLLMMLMTMVMVEKTTMNEYNDDET